MITISKPLPEDAEGMNEVIKASWYATYTTPEIGVTREDIDAMYAQNEARQVEVFKKRAISPTEGDNTLVAKEKGKVLGLLRLIVFPDHVRVRSAYIHPESTGKGIGTKLWDEMQQYIPQDKPVVAYPTEHTRSLEWYKKLGFVETGERDTETEAALVSGVRPVGIKMILKREV